MCIRIPLTSFSYRHIMICGGRLSLGNLLSRATSTRLVCDCDESARCAFLVVCGWFGLVCVLLIDTIASGRLPSPCFAFVFNSFFPSALLFFFFFFSCYRLWVGCCCGLGAGQKCASPCFLSGLLLFMSHVTYSAVAPPAALFAFEQRLHERAAEILAFSCS